MVRQVIRSNVRQNHSSFTMLRNKLENEWYDVLIRYIDEATHYRVLFETLTLTEVLTKFQKLACIITFLQCTLLSVIKGPKREQIRGSVGASTAGYFAIAQLF